MTLVDIYNKFPSKRDCINHLEELIWMGTPICPYCNSKHHTELKEDNRYHCNTCNTSYSVTVNTMFHKTKIDLQKWFFCIYLIMNTENSISSRELAKRLSTTKDTAWRISNQIKNSILKQNNLILNILKDVRNIESNA